VLEILNQVREQGWALADEELAPGIRSVSVGVRDGENIVRASMNITVHAQETSLEKLTGEYLPLLQAAASATGRDWALWQSRPVKSLKQ
jgi:IclR family pca regulon transcriptional regulator